MSIKEELKDPLTRWKIIDEKGYNEVLKETSVYEGIRDGKLLPVLLPPNSKAPYERGWQKATKTLEDVAHHKGGIGFLINENFQCIDIDGINLTNNKEYANPDDKKKPVYYIDCSDQELKEKEQYIIDYLKDVAIAAIHKYSETTYKDEPQSIRPAAYVAATASGKWHIFVRTPTPLKEHCFENFRFGENFPIPELRNQPLCGSIEAFTVTRKKQVVFSATINGRKYDKLQFVNYNTITGQLSYRASTDILDIIEIENLYETIGEELKLRGFYEQINTQSNIVSCEESGDNVKLKLDDQEIDELTDCLSIIYNKTKGRHEINFALGAIMEKNTPDTREKICISMRRKVNNWTDAEYRRFCENIIQSEKREGYKKGWPTIQKELQDRGISNEELFELRILLTKYCGMTTPLYINNYQYVNNGEKNIVIDFYNENTFIQTLKWNEKEEKYMIIGKERVFLYVPQRFVYLNNKIIEEPRRIQIDIRRKGRIEQYSNKSFKELEKTLSDYIATSSSVRGILPYIADYYEELGLTTKEDIYPVDGFFINPDNGELVKAIDGFEAPIRKPEPEEVKDAIDIWRRLGKTYKGEKAKLSTILRYGLICPFSFILKDVYKNPLQMLFLYGQSNTAKTALSEISLSPYVDITSDISVGAISSKAQVGEVLRRTAWGVVINEPDALFSNKNPQRSDIIQIFKRNYEQRFSREKYTNHDEYIKIPGYSNAIFTSNKMIPIEDAFIKRTKFVQFTKNERMSKEDQQTFMEEFGFNKLIQGSEFENLKPVGDFVASYIGENLDLLKKEHDVIVNTILDALFEYTQTNDMKWMYKECESMEIEEADNEILNMYTIMEREFIIKFDPTKNNLDIGFDGGETIIMPKLSQKDLWIRAITKGYSNHLEYNNVDGEDYIYINSKVSLDFKERYAGQTLTLKELAAYIEKPYKSFSVGGSKKKRIRLTLDEFLTLLNCDKI